MVRKKKVYESYAWMHRKFKIENLSQEEIAALAKTTQVTIHRWLIKHKLIKE